MSLQQKLEERKQVIWVLKDAMALVEKISKIQIMSKTHEKNALILLDQLVIEARLIMKGKGPTSQANTTNLEWTKNIHKLGI